MGKLNKVVFWQILSTLEHYADEISDMVVVRDLSTSDALYVFKSVITRQNSSSTSTFVKSRRIP